MTCAISFAILSLGFTCVTWSDDQRSPPVLQSDELVFTSGKFRQRRISFMSPQPSPHERNNIVWCEYFEPLSDQPVPAAIVLHSLAARAAHKEKAICRAMAESGMAGLLVTLPYHMRRRVPGTGVHNFLSEDIDQTLTAFRQANADALQALDWLASQPKVDAQRLGIVGVSVGAMLSVRVLAADSRLKVAVLIVGGGDIQELLAHSAIGRGLRRSLIRRHVNLSEALPKMREIDPLKYASAVKGRRVLMIDGIYDVVIPPQAARRLWEELGKPDMIWIPTGHFGALVHRGKLIHEGLRFAREAIGTNPIEHQRRERFKNLISPKIGIVGLTNGDVRPAIVGELFRFDRKGRYAFDVGVIPFRVTAGISANIAPVLPFGWTDLGFGVAMDRKGSSRAYLGLNFHF